MIMTFKEWKKGLSPKKHLFVLFFQNVVFWFVFPLLFDFFVWQSGRSIAYFAFSAPFKALGWTIIFNRNKVRGAFIKNSNSVKVQV